MTTVGLLGMRSSMASSWGSSSSISVRRSSPYLSRISNNSSLTMARRRRRLLRMARNSSIFAPSFSPSSLRELTSRAVRRCSRISKMALACLPVSFSSPMRARCAFAAVSEARMRRMTLLGALRARRRPSTMCIRSFAFPRSNRVRRWTTSSRNFRNSFRVSSRVRTLGSPPTKARLMTPKVVCRGV